MRKKFFMGGVTPNGFSTELTEIVNSGEYFTYILKGGPGTGKSVLMKKVADIFGDTEDVTCYYCSSDPASLDAVQLHSSKTIIVDGTPPHVFEPKYPGVRQKVINLGQYWDEGNLGEHSEEIIRATRTNKLLLSGAAYYNNALGIICNSTYNVAEGFLNRQMLEDEAYRFCDKLYVHHKKNRGKQGIRQLSVMTKNGYMTLMDTIEQYSDMYVLNDRLFAASDVFINIVAEKALEYGFSVKVSPCLLFGNFVREHLLIDDIRTALVTSNPLTNIKNSRSADIDLSLFYVQEQMQPYEKLLKTNNRLIETIAGISQEMLEDAKCFHDEIEKYYIDAMDFTALDGVCDDICNDIHRRGRLIMANEKILEILKEIKKDPKAKELFEGMEKPGSPDEAISAYAQVAEKLGYGITAEDIRVAVEQEEARRKEKTDKAVSDITELDDDELEDVAGGVSLCGLLVRFITEVIKE